ncbi:hypothetical protein FKW77_005569 [Venturia effusa]|uniref:BTB domain-containing protein n=1 Tax=Venturia effusa TaxID=50376 RepID=A0A517L1D6_9PEZI|nr:hypothetical protein FKW77_005569 [Venturia effusa]
MSHLGAKVCSPRRAIQSSLANNEYTDLLIECDNGKQSFMVHKAVVLPQCKFLKNSCKKEWEKKKYTEDGKISVIKLPDDGAVAVDAAIEFFYSNLYSRGNTSRKLAIPKSDQVKAAWKASEILCHVQVYIMAEKYELNELRTFAKGEITDGLRPTEQLPELHEVIRAVYKNTLPKDSLRASVSKFASEHGKEEFAVHGEKFGDLIVELPEFGRDLAKFLCEASSSTSHSRHSTSSSRKRRRLDVEEASSWSSSDSNYSVPYAGRWCGAPVYGWPS